MRASVFHTVFYRRICTTAGAKAPQYRIVVAGTLGQWDVSRSLSQSWLIFDDVVVPWEGIFVYKNPTLLAGITYIHTWGQYSTMLASSQILLSSLMQDIEILRCCIQVGESRGYMSPGSTWAPLLSAAYRVHSIEASDRAERTMEGLLTSYLILSGGAPSAREHLRLMAFAADMVMSPFGKRSQLYERLQSGEVDRMRQRLYSQHKNAAPAERMLKFVRAMGD
jgi:aromatic ring hydroxylase